MTNALKKNLNWFLNSGIMVPESGIWGVAERIAVCDGNEALEEMRKSFPAWMQYDGYCVLEQRRADCNFQTAFLFLLAFEVFGEKRYYDIAVNLLDYLYFRSGLLNRTQKEYPAGSWNWSHIRWEGVIFFDDNAWCVFIPLVIAKRYPELDAKYDLTKWALTLADELFTAMHRTFGVENPKEPGTWGDPECRWRGRYELPHWGSLATTALSRAYRIKPTPAWRDEVRRFGQIKEGARVHLAVRADVADALRHDLRLIPPDGGGERDELTVDVALFDDVLVDEGEPADARARERLAAPAAHAAQPEHGDAACMKFFDARFPHKERGARILFPHEPIISCTT